MSKKPNQNIDENNASKTDKKDKKILLQEKLKKLLLGRESIKNDYNFNHIKHDIPTSLEYNSDISIVSEVKTEKKQLDYKNQKAKNDNNLKSKEANNKKEDIKNNLNEEKIKYEKKNILEKDNIIQKIIFTEPEENESKKIKENNNKENNENSLTDEEKIQKEQRSKLLKLLLAKRQENIQEHPKLEKQQQEKKTLKSEKREEKLIQNNIETENKIKTKINGRYNKKKVLTNYNSSEEIKIETKQKNKCFRKLKFKNNILQNKSKTSENKDFKTNENKIPTLENNEENSTNKNFNSDLKKNNGVAKILELLISKKNEKSKKEQKEKKVEKEIYKKTLFRKTKESPIKKNRVITIKSIENNIKKKIDKTDNSIHSQDFKHSITKSLIDSDIRELIYKKMPSIDSPLNKINKKRNIKSQYIIPNNFIQNANTNLYIHNYNKKNDLYSKLIKNNFIKPSISLQKSYDKKVLRTIASSRTPFSNMNKIYSKKKAIIAKMKSNKKMIFNKNIYTSNLNTITSPEINDDYSYTKKNLAADKNRKKINNSSRYNLNSNYNFFKKDPVIDEAKIIWNPFKEQMIKENIKQSLENLVNNNINKRNN